MYIFSEKLKQLKPYDPADPAGRLRLDANESFLPLPEGAVEEALRSLPEFNRYPDPAARELCAAFGELYGVPAENVVAGNGSDELITVLFSAFLQKGEAFATVEPDFSMYAVNGFLQEARHVKLQKDGKNDFRLDIDKLIETCNNEHIRLLIFSNPCNPTSVVCPKEDIRRLLKNVSALVVLDEAYMDFSDQSLLPEFQDHDNLVILRTCSKAVGMAALRLGFAVARKELSDAIRAAKSPYNVNSLSQTVGAAVLRRKEELAAARETILQSKAQLVSGLEAIGRDFPGRFRLLPGETNFAALVLPDGEAAYRYFWERGVALRYTGGLLRITCGKPEENRRVFEVFREYLNQTEK